MSTNPVALILGAGPRIGISVARKFAGQGYQVAIVSRTGSGSSVARNEGFLSLNADFTKPESIAGLFETVENEFHSPPSVVVYNAGARTVPPIENQLFSNSPEALIADFNVNVLSPYVAAQHAVRGWARLSKDVSKTFIYTGNITNTTIMPIAATVNLGMGKSASAYWIGLADVLYKSQGFRFFYADERTSDGKIKGMELDGGAHADFYSSLSKHEGSVPWHATFVKGKGYVQFD